MKCLDCLDSPDNPTPPPQFSCVNSTFSASDGWVNVTDLHGITFKKKVNVGMSVVFPCVLYSKWVFIPIWFVKHISFFISKVKWAQAYICSKRRLKSGLIEMAAVCLLLAVDSTIISTPLWGVFLVSVQHYHKNLDVAVSGARNHTVDFTKS